jgi:hypothetical protein
MYSYHIFYFPFKWKIQERQSELFSEQTNLEHIRVDSSSGWKHNIAVPDEKEAHDLYNEKSFFYQFVHPVLYDTGKPDSIIKHFERREPQEREVSYIISVKDKKTYTLKVEAININLYVTGVGVMSFFLKNDNELQKEENDILLINQYGRRILPPFWDDIERKAETAAYIQITGLNGDLSAFKEDFSMYKIHGKTWYPACFIRNLVADLSANIEIEPVIDDRMFVNCWYANNDIVAKFKNEDKDGLIKFFVQNDFWYKYVFVDADTVTCQNDEMRERLLSEQTYKRWQKNGLLYGASRYSFVCISTNEWFPVNILAVHMRTVYSRMIELILIQCASRLRFSDEVPRVSHLSKGKEVNKHTVEQISSLYKEYIRFINQIHFREISIQDQGIELYQMISKTLNIENYVEKVDREISELYQYMDMLDDKIRNKNAEILNYIAAGFLPATLFFTLLSANEKHLSAISFGGIIVIGFALSALMLGILYLIKNNKSK